MKRSTPALSLWTLGLLGLVAAGGAQESGVDFLSRIESNPEVAKQIGLAKLSIDEKAALNELLNLVYQYGYVAAADISAEPEQDSDKGNGVLAQDAQAYVTKVDSEDGDIFRLENGAIVEVSVGYVGYVGYRKDAILFNVGAGWRLWIEGKKVFRCEVLRSPSAGRSRHAKVVYISEVKGDGSLLVLGDGTLLEVDPLDTITTSLWLGLSEALVLDDGELVNLDEGDEIISVARIR